MVRKEEERKGPICKQPISEPLEKSILCAMDECKKVIETMKSERQVDPDKLHQPVDL